MPTLTLKFKDNILETFDLQKGKSLTIGRRDDNDIVIENLAVSGHHAKIDTVGEGFVITDLKSKNGTFVNEQMVASHWLEHDDHIAVGKHSLTFLYDNSETRPKPPREKMEQTMIMDTGKYRDMLAKSEHLETLKASRGLAILSYLAGGEGEVELRKKLIKLGKSSSSDVVIKGLGVGKTCATISRRPDGYYLSYVGGMVRVKCNGEAVKQSVLLTEFDEIQIGSVRMQFVTKDTEPAPPLAAAAATQEAAPEAPAVPEVPEPVAPAAMADAPQEAAPANAPKPKAVKPEAAPANAPKPKPAPAKPKAAKPKAAPAKAAAPAKPKPQAKPKAKPQTPPAEPPPATEE